MAEKDFVIPPKLEKGDKLAVIASSHGIKRRFPAAFEKGLDRYRERFELEPVIFDSVKKSTDYLSEHPKERAEDLMEAFRDPEIRGVVSVTGGDEGIRMLKHLEPEVLRENPKRFYGISGNTDIQIYLWNLGIQSFYGGQILADLLADGEVFNFTAKYMERAFFEEALGQIHASEKFADDHIDPSGDDITDDRTRYENPGWEFWNFEGENIEGRLWGGCFEIIDWQMAAQKYIPDHSELEGAVLALETSEEAPSETEVKRWLMSMGENGILDKFSAIMVGRPCRQPLHREERNQEEKKEYHQAQKERIKGEINRYTPDTPVVFDVDFGHTDPKIPIQLGGKVKIKPEEEEILFKGE